MTTLTPFQMAGMVSDHRGANFVTVLARTVPDLLAYHPQTGERNPFLGNVVKVSEVNGVINWVYENSVNTRRMREDLTPDFQAFPRTWGQRLQGSPLVEHKGNYYLELKVEKPLGYHYETLDGQILNKEDVNAFLPLPSRSRQGLARPVILRDYGIENIRRIRFRGHDYVVAA